MTDQSGWAADRERLAVRCYCVGLALGLLVGLLIGGFYL